MKDVVTITVSGVPKSGKSHIAYAIKEMLDKQGMQVIVQDDELRNSFKPKVELMHFSEVTAILLQERIQK